jgi:hypothetical protein
MEDKIIGFEKKSLKESAHLETDIANNFPKGEGFVKSASEFRCGLGSNGSMAVPSALAFLPPKHYCQINEKDYNPFSFFNGLFSFCRSGFCPKSGRRGGCSMN